MKVLKFGGTSMASAQSILRVADIISKSEDAVIVVSASGKRDLFDKKITDLLYDCYQARLRDGRCEQAFKPIESRYLQIASELKIDGLKAYLDQIVHDINSGESLAYTVSRGEYLSALLLRHILNCTFIDAQEIIKFDANGKFDFDMSSNCIAKRLKGCQKAIIPGFYGAMPNGEIKTFSRGGSDITASVVASAIDASVYENWTDVDGVYFCPLIKECKTISFLSYRQMRELSYMGAFVLHPDSISVLNNKKIPIIIKNTFNEKAIGTKIDYFGEKSSQNIIAFSGKRGFKLINFYRLGASDDGYLDEIINEIKRKGAKIFTSIKGVDCLTLIIEGDDISFSGSQDIAVFSILAGNKMKALSKIAQLDIDYRALICDQFESGIVLAVLDKDYQDTLKRLYSSIGIND